MDDPDYHSDLQRAEQQIQRLLATIDRQAEQLARQAALLPHGITKTPAPLERPGIDP